MKDTIALIEKSQHGDKEAREILIEENLGLRKEGMIQTIYFRLGQSD